MLGFFFSHTKEYTGSLNLCDVIFYSSVFLADHPKANEYYSDPRLAAYAVPYAPILSWYHSNNPSKIYTILSDSAWCFN
jgi:hypothetical protein